MCTDLVIVFMSPIFHFEYLTYVLILNLQVVVETMSLIVFYGTMIFVVVMIGFYYSYHLQIWMQKNAFFYRFYSS